MTNFKNATLIELQDHIITKYAEAKIGDNRYGRQRRIIAGARNQVMRELERRGYTAASASSCVSDAMDIARLEFECGE